MSVEPPTTGYDPSYFAHLFAIEERHFWFRSRNAVLTTILRQELPSEGGTVLEVGCGTGNVLRILAGAAPSALVIGMDSFAEGLAFARSRTNSPLVQGDMHAPPFATKFDLIGLFDVLEHLPDDLQALQDLHEMLDTNGALVITVPAFPSLWSYFDEASHHYRRYTAKTLANQLMAAGLRIDYLTYYMAPIFPLVWLGRRLASLRGEASEERTRQLAVNELRIIPGVNAAISGILMIERHIVRSRLQLPFGTSLLAIARRNSTNSSYSNE